jgi:DNA-binding XRE family transcriptional regulator
MRKLKVNPSKLSILRITKGFTASSLAKLAGISKFIVIRLENGEGQTRPINALKIAEALGVQLGEVFEIVETQRGA